MSEAQNAIFEKNLRRGTLELAIATEVMVKSAFFEESSIAGEVIDCLSGNGKVKIRVLDLISDAAKYIFGKSFKDENMVD